MMAGELLKVCLVCLVLGSAFAAPKQAGSLISPCSLKDPQLERCMMTQARALLPRLATGIREWGLAPIDPLFVTNMELYSSGNSAVNLHLSGFNLSFTGFTSMTIESMKFDPEALRLEVSIMVPLLTGSGRYKISGQMLLLPISGQGTTEFSHERLHATIKMDFKRVEKGGKIYLKLTKTQYEEESVSKSNTYFDNLFNNKQLSDNMNHILSSNSMLVFRELRASINIAFTELMMLLWAPLFDRVPYSALFADTE